MQDNKSTEVKKRLLILAEYANVKRISGLAEYLGETKSKLYAWISNGNIADTGCILAKMPNINIEWLKTGQEPMTIYVPPPGDQIVLDLDERLNYSEQGKTERENENFNIDDMISMTRGVLASNTVYKSVLASSIRAFHKSVTMEMELENLEEKIDQLESQNDEISTRMERLERLLLSLGATLPEK